MFLRRLQSVVTIMWAILMATLGAFKIRNLQRTHVKTVFRYGLHFSSLVS